ncbi:hypothetical protein PSHT_09948 [Puccinia striiformis]|uniref:Uncharacterized protein n=1 Tax=Puccinia striiformis TaxID=27350 RepID=A0A2S4VD38_9BASI|nr:hypothetical protein PSHT_09948 [Puccinia striiformis]
MSLVNRLPNPYCLIPLLHPISEPRIELIRRLILVIKLLRLFLTKLSERGINSKRLPMYTTMNPQQLNTVGKLGRELEWVLHNLKEIFEHEARSNEVTAQMLTQNAELLKDHLKELFLLILLHVLPIVPNTDGFPTQNYYKAWFTAWKTQFTIAKNIFSARRDAPPYPGSPSEALRPVQRLPIRPTSRREEGDHGWAGNDLQHSRKHHKNTLWSPPAIAMVAHPTPSHKSRDHIIRNIGNKQASKVIEEFRHMSFKCRHAEPCKPGEEHLSIDPPGYKKKLFVELHLRTLPQLQEQIANLSQSKYPSIGRNDQHMEEFKPYRLHGLYHQLSEFLLDHIMDLSHQACELIEQLDLSMDTYFGKVDVARARELVLLEESRFMKSVDPVIDWLKGSELDIVQIGWSTEGPDINVTLYRTLNLIKQTVDPTQEDHQPETGPLSEPIIQLAESLLPIVKLSRVFLRKLSVRGMNRKRLPMFTKMCSTDLNNVAELVPNVVGDLDDVVTILRDAHSIDNLTTRQLLIEAVRVIEHHFKDPLLLILLHFVPIIPDTDGLPTQNYYRDWFADWKTMFTIAVGNFLNHAEVLQD